MVTIIPIDIDQDLVREGVQCAVAERLHGQLKPVQEMVNELRAGSLVSREEWERRWAALAAAQAEMLPILDYAMAFADQWPADDDEATDA
jgi:hypothetical protein